MAEEETDPQEELLKVHRKEKQELQDKIMALKQTATKGDKKKKKEVNSAIAKLEGDLNEKHSAELMELMLNGVSVSDEAEEPVSAETVTKEVRAEPEIRVSKAQKRREKKAEKEKQRLQDIEAQEEENLLGARHREQERIKELLHGRGLKVHEIPSDGDCLFASVAHQLSQRGVHMTVASLRQLTGEELQRNGDLYRPFLTHPRTGDMLTDSEYSSYCHTMASTPAWGGQVELLALSTFLDRPLTVVQAEGQDSVTVGEAKGKEVGLVVAYHRHVYGLGEHYNSTLPL